MPSAAHCGRHQIYRCNRCEIAHPDTYHDDPEDTTMTTTTFEILPKEPEADNRYFSTVLIGHVFMRDSNSCLKLRNSSEPDNTWNFTKKKVETLGEQIIVIPHNAQLSLWLP